MPRTERTTEMLRYTFTEEEKKERAETLALACQKKQMAREEKTAVMADFRTRIDNAEALIGKTSRDLNNGWEMRPIDCVVEFHVPTQGTKRISRADTGEIVREVGMDSSELQENLFGDEAKRGASGSAEQTSEEVEANAKRFFEKKGGETA